MAERIALTWDGVLEYRAAQSCFARPCTKTIAEVAGRLIGVFTTNGRAA